MLETDEYVRWPWKDLDALCGGTAPGSRPIYVVGFSGMGKTTFIRSAILGWARQGIGVDVLPLETNPERFMTDIACLLANVEPGLLTSGDYLKRDDAKELRASVVKEYRYCQREMFNDEAKRPESFLNPVKLHETPRLDVAGLWDACRQAQKRHAKVVVVDHVDHVQGSSANAYEVAREVNHAAHDIARTLGLVLVLMSQANNDALKGNTNHFAKYLPLRDSSIWMGGLKRQLASQVLGLYRPLRQMRRDETKEQYADALLKASKGGEGPTNVLEPRTMGVSLMKSENYGGREGQRVLLSWQSGRIVDHEALPYSLR